MTRRTKAPVHDIRDYIAMGRAVDRLGHEMQPERPAMTDKPEFPIEKNVPMPKRKRAPKYPFASMEIEDSFFIPDFPVKAAASRAACWTRKAGRRFSTRSVEEKVNGKLVSGVRIWRVE